MKKIFSFFLLALLVLSTTGCMHLQRQWRGGDPEIAKKEADVVLLATPIRVKKLEPGAQVDAIEHAPERMAYAEAVVMFKVEDVLKGEYTKIQTATPSKWEQAKDAAKDKNIWKILTLDFSEPEREETKQFLSVAVIHPRDTFDITAWDSPPKRHYRIYLQRQPQNPKSYILLAVRF